MRETYTAPGKLEERIRYSNGIRLINYCTSNNLIITNNFQQYKEILTFVKVVKNGAEKSVIEYIPTKKENTKSQQSKKRFRIIYISLNDRNNKLRKIVKDLVVNAKKNDWVKFVNKIEEDNFMFYKTIKQMRNGKQILLKQVKNE